MLSGAGQLQATRTWRHRTPARGRLASGLVAGLLVWPPPAHSY